MNAWETIFHTENRNICGSVSFDLFKWLTFFFIVHDKDAWQATNKSHQIKSNDGHTIVSKYLKNVAPTSIWDSKWCNFFQKSYFTVKLHVQQKKRDKKYLDHLVEWCGRGSKEKRVLHEKYLMWIALTVTAWKKGIRDEWKR